MNAYIVGMDGGGTKTAVAVADTLGNLLDEYHAGAINYNGDSPENVQSNLIKIFDEIRTRHGSLDNCRGICIGAAGICNPKAREALENMVRSCGYSGELVITGDDRTALCGAMGSMNGMILIAGTGSICFGRNDSGEEHRSGGYGHLIDDGGSGYAIGRDILTAVVKASDGRCAETVLTSMVFDQLGISAIEELIQFVYDRRTSKRDIARLAPNLTAACALNDPAALGIADRCGQELVELVTPVACRLGLTESEIATAGSILLYDKYVRGAFENKLKSLYPELTCIYPRHGAAYGAVLYLLGRKKPSFGHHSI